MSKREKKKVEEEPTEETVTTTMPESTVEPAKTMTDTVKVMVRVGTLRWEGGNFEKGAVFSVSRERALQMGDSVEILE